MVKCGEAINSRNQVMSHLMSVFILMLLLVVFVTHSADDL